MVSLNKHSVLLQTIKIEVSDDQNMKFVTVKVLFDSGSQKSYVTQRLVDCLNLRPVHKQDIYVNSFGCASGKFINTFEYKLCLKATDGSYCYIEGTCVPTICAPLKGNKAIDDVKRHSVR